jgi:hypothetical protein
LCLNEGLQQIVCYSLSLVVVGSVLEELVESYASS